jgi:hypothetical protein
MINSFCDGMKISNYWKIILVMSLILFSFLGLILIYHLNFPEQSIELFEFNISMNQLLYSIIFFGMLIALYFSDLKYFRNAPDIDYQNLPEDEQEKIKIYFRIFLWTIAYVMCLLFFYIVLFPIFDPNIYKFENLWFLIVITLLITGVYIISIHSLFHRKEYEEAQEKLRKFYGFR